MTEMKSQMHQSCLVQESLNERDQAELATKDQLEPGSAPMIARAESALEMLHATHDQAVGSVQQVPFD